MRILLVNASSIAFADGERWADRRRRSSYAPSTLALLGALVPAELNAEIRAVDEAVDVVPPDFANADLVGISAITCAAPRAYALADEARRQGRTVVLGGYHATHLPDEAAAHADAVVVGFAEEAWPALLRDHAAGALKPRYEGAWQDRFRSALPTPRMDLVNAKGYLLPATLEATRGCPNVCSFCIVPPQHGRAFVCREPAQIERDLEAIGRRRVAFLDANPGASREFVQDVLPRLSSLGVKWYGSAALPQASDPAWVRAAARSGLAGLVVGFETTNDESLVAEAKGFNRSARYRDAVSLLHDHGIAVLGTFMFGFDADDEAVFERTSKFVRSARIDLALYSIYTPFPGTSAWTRLVAEDRILSRDWSLYDGRHAVFRPARMTAERLRQGLLDAWDDTYSLLPILQRVEVGAATPFALAANLGFRAFRRTFGDG